MSKKIHGGGCHCGAVRFEAELDLDEAVNRCNCTMCTKLAQANVVIKPDAFRLLSGADSLTDYRRGDGPNHSPFCKVCGVHCYAYGNVPELGGDYYAVNVLCLDDIDPSLLTAQHWDGRHDNWAAGPRPAPWPVV
jgi:hypothetical protein